MRSISSNVSTSLRGSHVMPSSGMQYVQRKLQRSVTEIRRSLMTRPNGSTRSTHPGSHAQPYGAADARPTAARSAECSRSTATSAPAGTPVAVGQHDERVGERGGRQLVAALGADRADVVAAVVGERAGHPHEVDLAVGLAAQVGVGDGDEARCGRRGGGPSSAAAPGGPAARS